MTNTVAVNVDIGRDGVGSSGERDPCLSPVIRVLGPMTLQGMGWEE